MAEIGIGIIGGGYMGKAHAVAMSAVGPVFNTALRPRLEMVAASSDASAARYADAFGFARSTGNWRQLVGDPKVEAIVIASPPETHLEITRAAAAAGKPVFCEKPLGASIADAREMVATVEAARLVNMIGFNYIRTPAARFARQMIADGAIGEVTWFRGEHTEDFYADPDAPATWRAQGAANGCMGDLAPHMINAALALLGPIRSVMAEIETVHETRGGVAVTNDDQGQIMCRFESGVMGHMFFSRTATGRKMGYIYEVTGTKGAIRFNQEDQNSIWLYKAEGPEAERGFRQILTGPAHPDYEPFCLGPGHGTGYQDQIIIEARDFLAAIEAGQSLWPTFRDGLEVSEVVEAARRSSDARGWTDIETRSEQGSTRV
ncbi:MAG: Gfo/Idh/MocA family oxidoreductase [Paracoccaceae bacterium]